MGNDLALLAVGLAVGFIGISASYAEKLTVSIPNSDLASHTPGDSTLAKYYTIQFGIPNEIEGKDLLGAFLELYADVSAREMEGYTSEAPVFEVYALTDAYSGTFDRTKFKEPSVSQEDARLGNNKRIKIDVTEIVEYLPCESVQKLRTYSGLFHGF